MQSTSSAQFLGLSPELAQGLSLLLFVLAALLFLLTIMAVMKRRSRKQKALPGAATALLMIGIASFVGALLLKIL